MPASGACACTGIIGPGLGGGFGRYQGYFGLILDNIIEMDVVVADGSMITVSESSHSNLYWGLRGAGHNFGIVTRFHYKIYDIPYPEWYTVILKFTNDKLEAFFELLNTFSANGTQPKEVTIYALYAMDPEISATEVNSRSQWLLEIFSKLILSTDIASHHLHLRVRWSSRCSSAHASSVPCITAGYCSGFDRALHRFSARWRRWHHGSGLSARTQPAGVPRRLASLQHQLQSGHLGSVQENDE